MTKPEKKALVPALRFPEFKHVRAWEKKELKPYIEQYSERVISSTDLEVYSSTREGLKPQSTYFDGQNLVNDGEYGVVPHGYFVYRHMSDDDIFKFNINTLGKKIAVSKEYPVFRTVNLVSEFLRSQLNEGQDFKRFAASQKKGGTRTRLYLNTLCSFEPFLPTFDEQQKIADCLSSIDDLITAQTQKLAALKAHKKGLMQQLFPAEGETVPKLRFPEFRDVGEWKSYHLEEVASFLKGKGISKADIAIDGKLPCIRYGELYTFYGEVIKEVNSCTNLLAKDLVLSKANDVIIPASGETQEDIATASCVKKDGIALGGDLNIIRTKNNGVFLAYYLNSAKKKDIAQMAQGISVIHLYANQLKALNVQLPEIREQQKIADCLSSVDELITAQSQKIEALKKHKKGLMQQLFPSMDEDNHPPPAAYPSTEGELGDAPFPSSGGVDSKAGRGGSFPAIQNEE